MIASSGGSSMGGMECATIPPVRAWLPAAALVALVLAGFGLPRSPRIRMGDAPVPNALAHWRQAGRDWLVVADGKADEVAIYDAANGRLLQRLRISRGVKDAGGLVQRDGELYVADDDGTLEKLKPSPQLIAAAGSR